MTPEKVVQNKILDALRDLEKDGHPIIIQRRQAGSYNYSKGIPDVYFIYNGTHVECEVKRPGGHLSTMQEKWRDRCLQRNCLWCCVESIEDLKLFMRIHFDINI